MRITLGWHNGVRQSPDFLADAKVSWMPFPYAGTRLSRGLVAGHQGTDVIWCAAMVGISAINLYLGDHPHLPRIQHRYNMRWWQTLSLQIEIRKRKPQIKRVICSDMNRNYASHLLIMPRVALMEGVNLQFVLPALAAARITAIKAGGPLIPLIVDRGKWRVKCEQWSRLARR